MCCPPLKAIIIQRNTRLQTPKCVLRKASKTTAISPLAPHTHHCRPPSHQALEKPLTNTSAPHVSPEHKNTWTATHSASVVGDVSARNLCHSLRCDLRGDVHYVADVSNAAHLGVPLDTILQDVAHTVNRVTSSIYFDALPSSNGD